MKKILICLIGLLFLGFNVCYADDGYNINIAPEYKEVSVDDIVDIEYNFKSPNKNKNYIICIDIPKSLELIEFKINNEITDSKISELSKSYNRIYLPFEYIEETTISYKIKVTEDTPLNRNIGISFGVRDEATGSHIIKDWFKTNIKRVIAELG